MDSICYVTTSRGIILSELSTSAQAYAELTRLKQAPSNAKTKVVKGTCFRINLGPATAISIPENAEIVIIGENAYSYLKPKDTLLEFMRSGQLVTCPYTNAQGYIDVDWYEKWTA